MNAPRCPHCRGCGRGFGTLGTLRWYRCRNCGADFCKRKVARKRPSVASHTPRSSRRIVNERAWRAVDAGTRVVAHRVAIDASVSDDAFAGVPGIKP